MFCDLVGSTAFAESVDAETAREVMGRYHALAQGAIEAHGGTVAKFIGDGVMALWGIPEVSERDAADAVRCGAALQRDFAPLAAFVGNRHDIEVGLRVGINTGEVVVGSDDADLVGDVLNTAARLEAVCPPGQVVVGADTWRLTRTDFDFAAPVLAEVKGKADPLASYQLGSSEPARPQTQSRLIGRVGEVARLLTAHRAAVSDVAPQVVTVVGAPGVGKTRLVEDFAAMASDTALVLRLSGDEHGSGGLRAIGTLLTELSGISEDDEPDDILAALEAMFDPSIEDRARLAELLGTFVGAGEARSTDESFYAVRRSLELLSRRRPVIVIFDDAQWSAPIGFELIEHLALWLEESPITLVIVGRPELRDIQPRLTGDGPLADIVITLSGLDQRATAAVAADLLSVDDLPDSLRDRVHLSTAGNPLFVSEFVRMLVDDGIVRVVDRACEIVVPLTELADVPTIQSLLESRLERLPVTERHVLELASVMGAVFPRRILPEFDPQVPRRVVDDAISRLQRQDFIEVGPAAWGTEPTLAFQHTLLRDAAYRRLLKRERANLHLIAGAWIEANSTDTHRDDIAHHLEASYHYAAQLGPIGDDTRAIGRRAAALLGALAEEALAIDNLTSAGPFARRALDVLDKDDEDRIEILIVACEALISSGDVTEAGQFVRELLTSSSDERTICWGRCFEHQILLLTDPTRIDEAIEPTATAAERLAELGDDGGAAKALLVCADALVRTGRIADAEKVLDQALNAARRSGDRRQMAAMLSAAASAAVAGPRPVDVAGTRCIDIIRIHRVTKTSPLVEATALRSIAVLDALRGRPDQARTTLAESMAISRDLGDRAGLLSSEMFGGAIELLSGNAVAAEPILVSATDGMRQAGLQTDAGRAAAYLSRALLAQGRLDEAEAIAQRADEEAGQMSRTSVPAMATRAEVLTARGRFDEAIAMARAAVAEAADTDILMDQVNSHGVLARVLTATGDHEEARAVGEVAARLARQKGAQRVEGVSGPATTNRSENHQRPSDAPSAASGSRTAAGSEANAAPKGPGRPQPESGGQAGRASQTGQRENAGSDVGTSHQPPSGGPDQGSSVAMVDDPASTSMADLAAATDPPEDMGPSNRCSVLVRESLAELTADTVASTIDDMADDFQRHDRRRGISLGVMGPREQVAALDVLYEMGIQMQIGDCLEVRGETLALFRVGFSTEFTESGSLLFLFAINDKDRIDRVFSYDLDQRDEAISELDAVARERGIIDR